MLVLSRKPGESIVIDGRIVVKVMRLEGECVKLGIEAPAEVPVHRHEVYVEIQRNNQEAIADSQVKPPILAGTAAPGTKSNVAAAGSDSPGLVA
jgi:carbon storage regulator